MQKKDSDLRLTYSCILPRGKQKIVRVTFENNNSYAEGIIPDCKIEKQKGFSKEEIKQLELYLKFNKDDILQKARAITGINHWF